MSTENKEDELTHLGEDDGLGDYDGGEDYEDNELDQGAEAKKEEKRGSYVAIHATGFSDMMLQPELQRAVQDCGFEMPSEVQAHCIPQAIQGSDIICQAKSGMGKTAVFVLATLHQIRPEQDENGKNILDTLVLAHVRELAHQIHEEFKRFGKHLENIKTAEIYGGVPKRDHEKLFRTDPPHIVCGTPGRVKDLVQKRVMKVDKLKRFILDECDQLLSQTDMRADVQAIFKMTPYEKQVMMFTATLSEEVRPICRKFTENPTEVLVDDQKKLTLHGLRQFYVKLGENQKNRQLTDLLDKLEFNQVVIFVSNVKRAKELNRLLIECKFPSMAMYGRMKQDERISRYNKFKKNEERILVSTDIFGRGVDFEKVNIVINYDMPENDDQYLHRVGRSGRFGTKGLSISFIVKDSETDMDILKKVQDRFEVKVDEMPDEINPNDYMGA